MKHHTFLQRWEHWWFRPVPPHALAIFRIAFGAFLLAIWLHKLPQVPMLFSDRGLILPLWASLSTGPLHAFFPPTIALAWFLYAVFIIALLLFTLGVQMRLAGLVAFFLNVYYWFLSLHLFNTSFDRLFIVLLLVVALSGADRTLSWRSYWRSDFARWTPVSILPQRILALQITAVYLGVGFQKLWLPDWQTGEVLPSSMSGIWGTSIAFWFVQQHWPTWFYDASVFFIKFFEVTIPFGLWIPGLRRWFMAGGIIFHVLITLLLKIWWFLVLIPAYIVFFDPEDIRQRLQMSLGLDTRPEKNNE